MGTIWRAPTFGVNSSERGPMTSVLFVSLSVAHELEFSVPQNDV